MLDERGSVRWPCNHKAGGVADHARQWLRARRGQVYRDRREDQPRLPPLLRTGRILSQYNVGTQTGRTANSLWCKEDLLEIHPQDAEQRGIRDGDRGRLASRSGETRAQVTDRVAPGVVYTTFHHPTRRRTSSPPIIPTGDQLPGIQGHRRAGLAVKRSVTPGGGL
jgi:formate dehydrogenase major subunit